MNKEYIAYFKNSSITLTAPNLYTALLSARKIFKPSKREQGLIAVQVLSDQPQTSLHLQ